MYSYSFWSPVILVPLLAALMGKKTVPEAFYASMISGIFGMLFWNFLSCPFNIDGNVIGIIANTLTFCLVTKFSSSRLSSKESIAN